jgi:hypothetical protein
MLTNLQNKSINSEGDGPKGWQGNADISENLHKGPIR